MPNSEVTDSVRRSPDFLKGYRQALLDVAADLCIADHLGDAWGGIHGLARRVNIIVPVGGEAEPNADAVREAGGRLSFELPREGV